MLPKSKSGLRIAANHECLAELDTPALSQQHMNLIDSMEAKYGTSRLTWKGKDPSIDLPKLSPELIQKTREQDAEAKKEQKAKREEKKKEKAAGGAKGE